MLTFFKIVNDNFIYVKRNFIYVKRNFNMTLS